jgi:hypothetical protein
MSARNLSSYEVTLFTLEIIFRRIKKFKTETNERKKKEKDS